MKVISGMGIQASHGDPDTYQGKKHKKFQYANYLLHVLQEEKNEFFQYYQGTVSDTSYLCSRGNYGCWRWI